MIKTEKEYQNALERLKTEKELINKTKKQLESEGFTQEQVKRRYRSFNLF